MRSLYAAVLCFGITLNALQEVDDMLLNAMDQGNIDQMHVAFDQGANPDLIPSEETGYPLIVYAILSGLTGFDSASMVEILIQAGASVDTTVVLTDGTSCTLVELAHKCVESAHAQLTKCLELKNTSQDDEKIDEQQLNDYIALWRNQIGVVERAYALVKAAVEN